MATSDAFARLAAAAASVPASYFTSACGALALIAFSGEERCQITRAKNPVLAGCGTGLPPIGSTCAEPPPERTPTSACDPITAMVLTRGARGNWPLAFFSRTIDCSATRCATSRPWKTSGTWRSGELSNRPTANSERRMRWTMLSRRAMGTCPLSTAFLSAVDHVVEARHGHLPALHRFLERAGEIRGAGHLHIQPCQSGFGGRVRAAPIRQYESLETEVLFQGVGEQIAVFASVVAVQQVVGAHHGSGAGLLDANLECQQIALAN